MTFELRTNATNRRIRELISAVRSGALLARPDFQRRLVWTNKDKSAFIKTILDGFPFPEIYVCAGEVNPITAEGTEWLVDGQQRVSTIVAYFGADPALKLSAGIPPYSKLGERQKSFLEYTVVVRDLGSVPIDFVKDVFQRINSTKYGLNAMELANARYDGAIKKAAEKLAEHHFYSDHSVFAASDIRRMGDVSFQLTLLITMEQGYFDDTDDHEAFLEKYNDEYPQAPQNIERLETVFAFIERMSLPTDSRFWKKADLFTLLVELDSALHNRFDDITPVKVSLQLLMFETQLENHGKHADVSDSPLSKEVVANYSSAAAQGSNHRKNRITRGRAIGDLLQNAAHASINDLI